MKVLFETVLMDGDRVWGHIRGVSHNRASIMIEAQPINKADWKPVTELAALQDRLIFCTYKKEVPVDRGEIDLDGNR